MTTRDHDTLRGERFRVSSEGAFLADCASDEERFRTGLAARAFSKAESAATGTFA